MLLKDRVSDYRQCRFGFAAMKLSLCGACKGALQGSVAPGMAGLSFKVWESLAFRV